MTSSDFLIKLFAVAVATGVLCIAATPAPCQNGTDSFVAVNDLPRQGAKQSPSAVNQQSAPLPGTPGAKEQPQEKKKEKITVFEDDVVGEEEELPTGQTDLEVSIAVPHTKQSTSRVFVYPWPIKPPVLKDIIKPLPEKVGAIRGSLLQTGYVNRTSTDWPYPPGGWRWQHAYAAAVRKSGISLPHSIVEHYGWANKMVSYVRPEILAINEHERRRAKAHNRANQEFQDNFTLIRNKALRRGLEPQQLSQFGPSTPKVGRHYRARGLPVGKWWIISTHKAPGIKYYWWYPLDVTGDKPERVVLTEANAIYIEGGW